MVERLGYEVYADGGAAWHVSDHRTASFSIAVTETPGAARRIGRVVRVVAGIAVRRAAGAGEQLGWQTGRFTWQISAQGAPPGDGRPVRWHLRTPRGAALTRLVHASARTPLDGAAP